MFLNETIDKLFFSSLVLVTGYCNCCNNVSTNLVEGSKANNRMMQVWWLCHEQKTIAVTFQKMGQNFK